MIQFKQCYFINTSEWPTFIYNEISNNSISFNEGLCLSHRYSKNYHTNLWSFGVCCCLG